MRTFGTGIVALEMELTSGTWYTLWAPNWIVRGESWQAFLGDDSKVFAFESPAQLLAFLREGGRNELAEHPKWKNFERDLAESVVPVSKGKVSLIEVPRHLAQRPGYESTNAVTRGFDLLRSFGSVLGIRSINQWFASFSILNNTRRGADHYQSTHGLEEWSGVGRTVVDRWAGMLDEIEPFLTTPEVSAESVSAAEEEIAAAKKAREEKLAALSKKEEEAEKAADPYDSTIWAEVGIDPIRISMDGQYVYTLRCYVDSKPKFLGRYGQINTFPNSKSLVRWLIDAPEHDLDQLATWGNVLTAANSGELEVTVHESNQYAFGGLRKDIESGVEAVDTDQLARAYELLADSADWAGDDAVNKTLLRYPKLQNYLAYMLGAPSEATPSAPFDEEVKGWKQLEDDLVKRFTKF